MTKCCLSLLALLLLVPAAPARPQHDHPPADKKPEEASADPQHVHQSPPAEEPEQVREHDHDRHGVSARDSVSGFLMQQASGTSVNPASAEMHGMHRELGAWSVMHHGLAFLNGVAQTGPRGEEEVFSTNWLMIMGDRPLGQGRLALRGMFSLEPATVPGKYYPELFQTGELADGEPIVDGQHPHDFFMELAGEYARELRPGMIGYTYGALHGDPALGPVAFPHRVSAMEIPQATLGHHLQDSTHIAASVVTLGLSTGLLRIEASGFHGEEPDEERWDLDLGSIDSWSARLVLTPSPHWVAQISTGHLADPEAHQPGDIQRTTASLLHHQPTRFGEMSHGLIWGRNDPDDGDTLDSFTLESLVRIGERNHLTGRVEVVERSSHDLFPEEDGHHEELEDEVFRIRALTLGYVRDIVSTATAVYGIGANATLYWFDDALEHFYGSSPKSYLLFLRVRSAGSMRGMTH